MQKSDKNDIRERIAGLVSSILAQNGIDRAIEPHARLSDVGMTSMDMVGLMLRVEAEFDIAIPQSEITAENFRSVASIETMIARQLDAAGALKAVA